MLSMVPVCLSVRRDEPWAESGSSVSSCVSSVPLGCVKVSTCPCTDVLEPSPVGPGEGCREWPPNQTSLIADCLPNVPTVPLTALTSAKKESFRVPNAFSEITLSPALLWAVPRWWWSRLGMFTYTAPQKEPEPLRAGAPFQEHQRPSPWPPRGECRKGHTLPKWQRHPRNETPHHEYHQNLLGKTRADSRGSEEY